MIVAVAIFVILMTMVVPRLGNTDRRQAGILADGIADLLTVFAQRDGMGTGAVAIDYNPRTRELSLLAGDGAQRDDSGRPAWRVDRFVTPLRVPDRIDLLAPIVGGTTLDQEAWRITTRPGEQRPDVEIIIDADGGRINVFLPSYAIAPVRSDIEDGAATLSARQPHDLDASGQYREDW